MNKFRFTMAAIALTLLVSASAQAQATRTWVSGVGDDVNPCSRTAPCKTFAGAISKTADKGEIDALDPGGFGTITITKNITIDGSGTMASILAAGTNGVNVNDSATATPNTIVVTLRNLSINGAGSGLVGISVISGKTVHVENVVISGFLAGTARGINDTRTNGGNIFIKDSLVRNCGSAGIVIASANPLNASIDNTRVEQNGNNGSGSGVVFSGAGVKGAISRSVASKNKSFGIAAEGGAKVKIDSCQVTLNESNGVDANAAATEVRISNTMVSSNLGSGLGLSGGTIRSYGNNMLRGNGVDTAPTNTDTQQ
ncbi:MAG TPA: right-handed parallel beta-helix repeat-containing protein [Pyrinomonadaceae bacterium]|jgi:hypothetical protein